MYTLLLGFIGPQEIIMIILFLMAPGAFMVIVIVYLIRRSTRKGGADKVATQIDKSIDAEKDSLLSKEKIKDYYPVKEGSKITLIPFNEIVDLSTGNNFVFLTDKEGKEYLVESTLLELEDKFPEEFIRIHKSTIVNKHLIREVKKMGNGRFDLVMKCEKDRVVTCSKSYNEKIKSLIDF